MAFDEQYFIGPDRVADVDKKTLTDSKGRQVAAVLTSIRIAKLDTDVSTAIRDAIFSHDWGSHTDHPILLRVDHWSTGRIEVQFTRGDEDRFDGLVTYIEQNEVANDRWFAFVQDDSIDYILGCYESSSNIRPQLVCYGTFAVGSAEAFVSLYGRDISDVSSAFVANRRAILSFLAR